MIIIGDINLYFLKKHPIPSRWFEIMDTFNLHQLITEPTRITKTTKSCIDHIYVSNVEHICAPKVPYIGISDHFPVCYVRKHISINHIKAHNTIKYRSYKDFDEHAFLEDLKTVPVTLCEAFDDTNDTLAFWKTLFLDIVNTHAPHKERRVKKQVQPERFNDDIQEAMYLRDKYCSVNDTENYVYWRNKATELKRVSRSIYYKELIIASKNNTRKLWKLLSELVPKETLQDPVTLKDGETTLSDPQDICEPFNRFFTNIASSLTHNMQLASDDAQAKL